MATFFAVAVSFAAIGVAHASTVDLPTTATPTMVRTPSSPSLPPAGGTLWANHNAFGAGTMSTPGNVPITSTTFIPSSSGSNITARAETGSVEFSDGTDRLVLQKNDLGGYTVTRSKTGYSGIQEGVYNSQGNLVQSQDTLATFASAAFVDGLSSMRNFIAVGAARSSGTQGGGMFVRTEGGFMVNAISASCGGAMIYDSLGMLGTGIGIGMSWLGGPWLGIPGTIGGIAALHWFAVDVTKKCYPR